MPLRILLADDAAAIRRTVTGLLEQEGFEIVGVAADGGEALRMARQVCPDVAVVDLTMPVLDGLELTRQLHQLCPQTPVILLTVHSEAHQIQQAFATGVRGYVVKTRAVEDLRRAIEVVARGGQFVSPGAGLDDPDEDHPTLCGRMRTPR